MRPAAIAEAAVATERRTHVADRVIGSETGLPAAIDDGARQ
jgi:hypothetical protein